MYQRNPSDYGRNSSAQERAVYAVIARLYLRGNEHILDGSVARVGMGVLEVKAGKTATFSHDRMLIVR